MPQCSIRAVLFLPISRAGSQPMARDPAIHCQVTHRFRTRCPTSRPTRLQTGRTERLAEPGQIVGHPGPDFVVGERVGFLRSRPPDTERKPSHPARLPPVVKRGFGVGVHAQVCLYAGRVLPQSVQYADAVFVIAAGRHGVGGDPQEYCGIGVRIGCSTQAEG